MSEEFENERKALQSEIIGLRRQASNTIDAARDIFYSIPMSGVSWIECGRILLHPMRPTEPSQIPVHVQVNFGPNSIGIQRKRAVCWVVSTTTFPSIIKLPPSSVKIDENNSSLMNVELPETLVGGAWCDPTSTMEWIAFAHPETSIIIRDLVQEIESRPSFDEEMMKKITEICLKKRRCLIDDGDTKGRTMLHAACSSGNLQLAIWLITKAKAKVDCLDSTMWTPLFCSLSEGHFEIAEFLIKACKANVKHRTLNGSNAIHAICSSSGDGDGFESMLEDLISNGVDVNEQRADGITPLLLLCQRGAVPRRVDLLLKKGANPNCKNPSGDTALHLAILSGNIQSARLLGQFNADNKIIGSRGKSAIDLALEMNNKEMISVIDSMSSNLEYLSDWVLGWIFALLPPKDLCNARQVSRLFNRIGTMVLERDDYWLYHRITKTNFFSQKQLLLQYGRGLKNWISPPPPPPIEVQQDYFFKIVILGSHGCGSSNFVRRLAHENFFETTTTLEVDFKVLKRLTADNKYLKMLVWDKPIPDRFRPVNSSYYRGAKGVFILYDITDRESFKAIPMYLQEVDRYAWENTPILIIGTKGDLEDNRQISLNEAEEFARNIEKPHLTVSSKTGFNVDLAGKILADMAIKKLNEDLAENASKVVTKGITGAAKRKPQTKSDKDCSLM